MTLRLSGWIWVTTVLLVLHVNAEASVAAAQCPQLSADEVVRKLAQKNHERAEALREFQGTRIYRMQYRGLPSDKDAEMTVTVNYKSPDKKEFTVVSESGSKFILNHVLKKLLDGEREAAGEENQRRTALSAENYDFQMDGCENTASGPQFVLTVSPKSKNKFLYRGKVWVDSRDFAVTQIEAEPAKNPSFWITKTSIEHKYVKVDNFWLPAENHSESNIRLGGRASLTIEYKDYKVIATSPTQQNRQDSGNSRSLTVSAWAAGNLSRFAGQHDPDTSSRHTQCSLQTAQTSTREDSPPSNAKGEAAWLPLVSELDSAVRR